MNSPLSWVSLIGRFEERKDILTFQGGTHIDPQTERENTEIGLSICNKQFSEGTVSVDVKFSGQSHNAAADIVLYYNPQKKWTLNAGMTAYNQFAIRHFDDHWTAHATAGSANAIKANKKYHLEASLRGSTIALSCDGVEVLRTTIPFTLPQSQVGVFAVDKTNIEFSNFKVHPVRPKAFVVMQFSAQFDEVYSEVIKTVCSDENIDVTRIDEEAGPGLIIADITKAITDAKVIIADISPVNANVFYEVGYAHALNKPTILLAEKGTKLPFDVSSFRTLFYENTIGGKRIFEEGLRRHLNAVLQQQS